MSDPGAPAGDKLAAIRRQMDSIGERFVQRLLEELVTMRDTVASLKSGDATAVETLMLFAHKISGSSAMFGFGDLSARAGELEVLLAKARAQGGPAPLPEIEEKFGRLEEAASKAAKRSQPQ